MTLTEFRYIVAVARERHFGHAAKACFVSQPTLSVAVKKLEKELGIQVFERSGGEIQVTPIGEQIVAQAQRALEEAEGVKQIAQQGRDQLSETLRIGAIYTVGPYLFPELISTLKTHAPKMPLIVQEDFTSVLTERLIRGDLDVIIVALPFERSGLLTLPLYKEPFVALLPAAHPLTANEVICNADLKEDNLLLLGAGHCFRDQVLEACPDCLPKPGLEGDLQQTLEGGSLETIRYMVASGMGITVLPCTAVRADQFSQRLVTIRRLRNPSPSRTIVLAWRVSFPRPKVIDALRAAIADCHLSCVELM